MKWRRSGGCSLNYGNDGYEMVFSRLSQKHPEQE